MLRKNIIPLPKLLPEKWTQETMFNKGEIVLALFPGTTSFYKGVVMATPNNKSTKGNSYQIHFADDEDENGKPPSRSVPPQYVINYPNDKWKENFHKIKKKKKERNFFLWKRKKK